MTVVPNEKGPLMRAFAESKSEDWDWDWTDFVDQKSLLEVP
jgi:hypothetical protein